MSVLSIIFAALKLNKLVSVIPNMTLNNYKLFLFFAFAKAILLLHSCNSVQDQREQEIAAIPIDVEMRLFHHEFAQATAQDLPKLKEKYPELFPARYSDSLWLAKIHGTDTIHDVLENAVQQAQLDYNKMEDQVKDVMRHVQYYFPDFEPTSITTVLSEVNFRQPVTPSSNSLYIGVDNYLGADHELYMGINDYQRDELHAAQLPADVAMAYAHLFVPPTTDRTLLGSMIYFGKLHYLQEQFAPQSLGMQRFKATAEKYEYMVANESQMWRYLVDKSLLFDTDPRLSSRFILPAPFSKFYLEIDQKTPGGIGKYIGYRIISDFMKNNKVDLELMLQLPAQDLFEKSGYKPLP